MSKLHKLVSTTLLAVAMAVVVMLALKPAPVEAAGGRFDWVVRDEGGYELTYYGQSRKVMKIWCGQSFAGHSDPVVWIAKVGTERNICR